MSKCCQIELFLRKYTVNTVSRAAHSNLIWKPFAFQRLFLHSWSRQESSTMRVWSCVKSLSWENSLKDENWSGTVIGQWWATNKVSPKSANFFPVKKHVPRIQKHVPRIQKQYCKPFFNLYLIHFGAFSVPFNPFLTFFNEKCPFSPCEWHFSGVKWADFLKFLQIF